MEMSGMLMKFTVSYRIRYKGGDAGELRKVSGAITTTDLKVDDNLRLFVEELVSEKESGSNLGDITIERVKMTSSHPITQSGSTGFKPTFKN